MYNGKTFMEVCMHRAFRFLFIIFILFFVLGCTIAIPSFSSVTATPAPTSTPVLTNTPVPTNTPKPTITPIVTATETLLQPYAFANVSLNNAVLPAGWRAFTIEELRAKGLDLTTLMSSLTASIPQLMSIGTSAVGQIDNPANFGFALSFIYGIQDPASSAMADLIIASPDQIIQGMLKGAPGSTAEVDKTAAQVGDKSVLLKGVMNNSIAFDFLISRRQSVLQFLLNMHLSTTPPLKSAVAFGQELDGMILKALGQ